MLEIELRLSSVLDLTDDTVAAEWGMDAERLCAEDVTSCQEVAAAARRTGYEAILYPSAAGPGTNIALFFDRLHPGSFAVIVEQRPIDLRTLPTP